MPNLGRYLPVLDSVFYLYRSREDAEAGKKSGGTGFIAALPTKIDPNRAHFVGVTNWHVACRGSSVVRMNLKDGGFAIFEFGPEEWTFDPNGADVAVTRLPFNRNLHKGYGMRPSSFLTEERNKTIEIDVGDDVFMVGRFVDYDGIETNKPSLRFGHISIMDAAVKQPNGYRGRSIVVDMHCRTGYSGSPVFVYRTPGSHFAEHDEANPLQSQIIFGHTFMFLGMTWGQFPEKWKLKDGRTAEVDSHAEAGSLITDGKYVEGMSGMTCVVSPDDILKVLRMDEIQGKLNAVEAVWAQQK